LISGSKADFNSDICAPKLLSVAKRQLALVSQDSPRSPTPPSNEELQGLGVEHDMGDDNVDEDAANMLAFSEMDLIDPILRNANLSDEHPGLKFVLHFAKMDITIAPVSSKMRERILSGEVPRTLGEPFQYKCSNRVYGCPYQHERKSIVDVHMLACEYVDEEAGHRIENGKRGSLELPFRRDWEECQLAYESQHLLNKHMACHRSKAKFVPKTCPECDSEQVFNDQNALSYHIRKCHPKRTYVPRNCRVPGCKSADRIYESWTTRESHLKGVHRIAKSKDKERYIYGEQDEQ
jgi:hypothetical protein